MTLSSPSRTSAAAMAAALTLLVAGVAGWTTFDRTVTLEVDGEAQQVRILGSEVSDVLSAADVEVSERDLVSPAPDETVADGQQVTVRYARQVTVADPTGDERSFWTTELTVDEALAAAGLRHEGAWLSASRSAAIGRSGLSLTMSVPKTLTVVADGKTREVSSPAPTVADLLDELDITLTGRDRVEPSEDTVLAEGQTVRVERLTEERVVETRSIDFETRTVDDDDLFVGEEEVRTAGTEGELEITYRVVLVDGVEGLRQELERTVVTEPVDRVVAEGTKERPAPEPEPVRRSSGSSSSSSSSDSSEESSSSSSSRSSGGSSSSPAPSAGDDVTSLNWAALAQCESGGSPTIVSSNGLYHGLYQFDRGTWQSMGGSGVASQAPASEQTARAQALYEARGASPWPSCGSRLFS